MTIEKYKRDWKNIYVFFRNTLKSGLGLSGLKDLTETQISNLQSAYMSLADGQTYYTDKSGSRSLILACLRKAGLSEGIYFNSAAYLFWYLPAMSGTKGTFSDMIKKRYPNTVAPFRANLDYWKNPVKIFSIPEAKPEIASIPVKSSQTTQSVKIDTVETKPEQAQAVTVYNPQVKSAETQNQSISVPKMENKDLITYAVLAAALLGIF